MKQIDVKDQPSLGAARTLRLTINGIRYRLFRSAVTVTVIVVAIAFLTNSLAEGLVRRAVAADTTKELKTVGKARSWAGQVQSVGTRTGILDALVAGEPIFGPTPDATLLGQLSQTQTLIQSLESLSYGHRRTLVHNRTGTTMLDYLATTDQRAATEAALTTNRRIRLSAEGPALGAILDAWPTVSAAIDAESAARKAALKALAPALAGSTPLECLTEADGPFGKQMLDAGVPFPSADSALIAEQAKEALEQAKLEKFMSMASVRQRVAARQDLLPNDVTAPYLWKSLRSKKFADWFATACAEEDPEAVLAGERLQELAEHYRAHRRLESAAALGAGISGGFLGLGPRLGWLLLISMMVCGVGIANAMLMTVTERFKEIATLKCLGALDGFVMLTFVLEASLLGLAGGSVGSVLGMGIGLMRMTTVYGSRAISAGSVTEFLLGILAAVAVGILLAIAAAIYPSLRASRLAPMEAMRVE